MMDTSQIVTPFNALWSHNVVHNCDQATFITDCCYYILQQLLGSYMSTKAYVKFESLPHPTQSTLRNMLRLLTNTSFLYFW